MNVSPSHRRWSEFASVAISVIAIAFLFFEIIYSQLPSSMRAAIEPSGGLIAWVVAAAIGLSLLCSGIGVISITSFRLMLALRKVDDSAVNAAAKDQLLSAAMVIIGFLLTVSVSLILSQASLRPS